MEATTEEQKAKELLQKATNSFFNESYELALEYYKDIKANTNYSIYIDAEAYNNMGFCYDKLDNDNEAITCYQKSIAINPNDAEANMLLAISYFAVQENELGIYYLKNAYQIDHTICDITFEAANSQYQSGKYNDAILCYSLITEMNPSYDKAYYNIGLAYNKIGNTRKAVACMITAARKGNVEAQKYLRSVGLTW